MTANTTDPIASIRADLARIRRVAADTLQAVSGTSRSRFLPPLLPSARRRETQHQEYQVRVTAAAEELSSATDAVDTALTYPDSRQQLQAAMDRLNAALAAFTDRAGSAATEGIR